MPSWRPPTPRALPVGKNCESRHLWETSILAYSDLIGEVFENKKEAVLKFTEENVVRTTDIMDRMVELGLMSKYADWLADNYWLKEDDEYLKFFHYLVKRSGLNGRIKDGLDENEAIFSQESRT